MKLSFTLLYTLLLCILNNWCHAQTVTIRGLVLDARKRNPLPGASVFLANTTKGTTASADGSFVLPNVPPGRYQLVASYLGFKTNMTVIESKDKYSYTLLLTEQSRQLDDVVVTARRRRSLEWQENLRFFEENFIGQSENAAYCRLENPQILFFDKTDERFVAGAHEALLLENRGLGYRLRIQLEDFTYTYAQSNVRYKGYVSYDTLVPKNADEQAFWIRNRKKAYYGSINHFMRSLYDRSLTDDGFFMRRLVSRQNRQGQGKLVALPADTTVQLSRMLRFRNVTMPTLRYNQMLDSTAIQPILNFGGLLEVTFSREEAPYKYLKRTEREWQHTLGTPQISLLELVHPPVTIQADGQYFPPDGVRIRDYWTWERIAEDLPVDFKPPVVKAY